MLIIPGRAVSRAGGPEVSDERGDYNGWMSERLNALTDAGTLREIPSRTASGVHFQSQGRNFVHFGSNDYLGLAKCREIAEAARSALDCDGLGTGSARVLFGGLELHSALEAETAALLGAPACLLFGAGYLANLGVLSTVPTRECLVVSDRAVHGSLLDGIGLSRARHLRFAHNEIADLTRVLETYSHTARQTFIVSESVFSMDGDRAPLAEMASLCRRFRAKLVIDEAHAVGVYGKGAGCCAAESAVDGLEVLRTGTYSKSFGAFGGFVCCDAHTRQVLCSTSRSFLFQTSLPMAVTAGALAALRQVRRLPENGALLLRRAEALRTAIRALGFNCGNGDSQIIPIPTGSISAGLELRKRLEREGLCVPLIRHPTVRKGTERLRISLTVEHRDEDIARLLSVLGDARRWL